MARIAVAIVGGFWGITFLRLALDYKQQSKTVTAWSIIYGLILTGIAAAMIGEIAGL